MTKDELTTEIRFDQNNDGLVNDEEAEFYMSGNESYQRDSFIDNGWPLIKPALTEEEATDNRDTGDSKPEYNDEDEEHIDTDIDDEDDEEEEDYEDDEDHEAAHVRQPPDHEDIADEGNKNCNSSSNLQSLKNFNSWPTFIAKIFSISSSFIVHTAPQEEKPKESKYDEATQALVDAADAARKEFDEVDRKHR